MAGAPDPEVLTPPRPTRGDALRLGWAVLTSPRTLLGALVGLAGVLMLGATFPQRSGLADLASDHAFSAARAATGLGLSDVLVSWPFTLLLLIAGLSAIGIGLRWWLDPPSPDDTGVLVGRAVGWVTWAPDQARERLTLRGALARKPRTLGGHVRVDFGLFGEALVVLTFGVVALLAASFVGRGALDGRMTLTTGTADTTAAAIRTQVREADDWLDGGLPVLLTCGAADPQDPRRTRTCQVRSGEDATQIVLRSGETTSAFGLQLRAERETPVGSPTLPEMQLLVGFADLGPQRFEGHAGTTYQLQDGTRITPFDGPDGALVVARRGDGRPVLLAPARVGAGVAVPDGGPVLSGLPGWRLRVGVRGHPERFLLWTGLGLVVLALLQLALVPSGFVVLERVDERTRVTVVSRNRRGYPDRVLHGLGGS